MHDCNLDTDFKNCISHHPYLPGTVLGCDDLVLDNDLLEGLSDTLVHSSVQILPPLLIHYSIEVNFMHFFLSVLHISNACKK